MNEGLIPRRYAKALYKVAIERNCARQLYAEMTTLADSFAQNPKLAATIANPYISAEQKISLLNVAAGVTSDATYADFLKLLINNRRIAAMRDIALAYQEIYRKANSIYVVNLTSATALDSTEVERLRKLVMNNLPEGASIEFNQIVDPSLIGGFTISIDNERLDASINNELKQLRLKLISN